MFIFVSECRSRLAGVTTKEKRVAEDIPERKYLNKYLGKL